MGGKARGFSELDLGSSPVSSLRVVPDFIVSLVPDPVRQRSVLLDLFSQMQFLPKDLYGTLKMWSDEGQKALTISLLI